MTRIVLATLIVLAATVAMPAQQEIEPQGNFRIDTTPVVLGGTFTLSLSGMPFSNFVLLTDAFPGALTFPGFGSLWLAFSPLFRVAIDSLGGGDFPLDQNGRTAFQVPFPPNPGLDGIRSYLQAFGTDFASPTGFAFSNAKSLLFSLPDSYHATFGTMTEPRAFHQLAPLPNGGCLVVGGGNGALLLPAARRTTSRYNPYLRTFVSDAPMSVERTLHRATALNDGRILVSGGCVTLGAGLSTMEIYDPATSTWSAPITMTVNRIGHTATLLPDGRVLLCGGSTSFVLNPPTSTNYLPIFQSGVDTAEIFDPVTGTLTPAANTMTHRRFGHAATVLPSGKVMISGGIRDGFMVGGMSGTGAPLYATDCDIFDPATDTFTTAAALNVPRIVHTQNRLPNGQLLVVGGAGGLLVSSTSTTEIYDEPTDTWSPGPPLPASQTLALHTSTVLADGSIYVAGGAVGTAGLFLGVDVAYRFRQGAGWTALGPLDTPRQAHAAIDTPEGVLLVGGADAGDPVNMVPANAMDTATIYTPN